MTWEKSDHPSTEKERAREREEKRCDPKDTDNPDKDTVQAWVSLTKVGAGQNYAKVNWEKYSLSCKKKQKNVDCFWNGTSWRAAALRIRFHRCTTLIAKILSWVVLSWNVVILLLKGPNSLTNWTEANNFQFNWRFLLKSSAQNGRKPSFLPVEKSLCQNWPAILWHRNKIRYRPQEDQPRPTLKPKYGREETF